MAVSDSNSRQAAWVALGNLFSTGFGIVSAMILSRFFSIEDYGLYKQVMYVYSTLVGFFMLGLPKAFAYFLPRSPLNEAKSLIRKLTRLFFILGGTLSLLLFCGAGIIEDFLKSPGLAGPLRLFSPVPFLLMPTMGLEGILATYRKTMFISVYVVLTRLAMLLCICLPVMIWDVGCDGAVVGFVVSSAVTFVIALYLKYYPVKNEGNAPTTETYGNIFRFCLPLFFAMIWGILINSTSQFFISRYYGPEVFALFSNGAIELPFVGMIVGASTAVLTPLFTRALHEKESLDKTILPVWNSAFAKSVMLIYPLAVFCIMDADLLMTLMYGERYVGSGIFFKVSVVSYFFRVIVFYSLIMALRATQYYQWMMMSWFILMGTCDYIMVTFFSSPILISVVNTAFNILAVIANILYISKKLHTTVLKFIPVGIVLKVLLACGAAVAAVRIIPDHWAPSELLTRAFFDGIVFAAVGFVVATALKLKYIDIVKPIFLR